MKKDCDSKNILLYGKKIILMKRLREAKDIKPFRLKKKVKTHETTIDGTPICDARGVKLEDGREQYVFYKILRIPAAKRFFEVDMLKIQMTRKNLTIPNFNINITLNEKPISDSFYFANGNKLKTAHGPNNAGIFISKEEILENNVHSERCNFFNIFFLAKEDCPLVTLGEGWYDRALSIQEVVWDHINKPTMCSEIIMHIYYYSGDELKNDVKKFMLLLELLHFDISKSIMLNYLVPFITSNCGYGIRRKEDSVNFDKSGNGYVLGNKWDGQPKGFQEMLHSFMWSFISSGEIDMPD